MSLALKRILPIGLGLVLTGLGGFGISLSRAPEFPGVALGHRLLEVAVPGVASLLGSSMTPASVAKLLAGPGVGVGFALVGMLLLVLGARRRAAPVLQESRLDEPALPSADRRTRKRTEKLARGLARKGEVVEAGELCFENGMVEEAASYFVQAENFVRAAEIRHDQNRFSECADLYIQGEEYEVAGTILAILEDWPRAAELSLKVGRHSVAGEMFEKAGDFRRAGDCYVEAGFHRHAAKAYVRAEAWAPAARALEETVVSEMSGGGMDSGRSQELRTLVLQAAKLYEEAGDPERAQAVLIRGECWGAAAEIAHRRKEFEESADLFTRAHDPTRAADALGRAGNEMGAARILAEYHRDRGEREEAARWFDEAGEFVESGDLHRQAAAYLPAGESYVRGGEHFQAAEMFRLAEHLPRAAENYGKAGDHAEAAGCWALAGEPRREAESLYDAGRFHQAGKSFLGLEEPDEALKALQRVEPGDEDFQAASSLLGALFRDRGEPAVAITKLRQAIEGQEITAQSVETFFTLATVLEAQDELVEAADLFERVLAFDFHFEDAEARLARVRARLEIQPQVAGEGGGTTALSRSGRPGRYQIVGELGRGGMGIVWKAKDTVLDRMVAFKTLPDALKDNPQSLRNFLREAKSAAQLNHPNIVTIYDAGEQDGAYFIAMEYVDGTNLKEILARRKVIPLQGLLHITVQMCEALAYAHEKKIVHRDIKTANTMWTRDRKAKIMDFGLAKVVEEVRNNTTLIAGTPYYMSPEQTLGNAVDQRTDIYSLGVTLCEMATGTLPFKDGNVPYHHVHTPPPDPQSLNPKLPEAVSRMILRCLEKDPDARYSSAQEILADVRAMRPPAPSGSNDAAPDDV